MNETEMRFNPPYQPIVYTGCDANNACRDYSFKEAVNGAKPAHNQRSGKAHKDIR